MTPIFGKTGERRADLGISTGVQVTVKITGSKKARSKKKH